MQRLELTRKRVFLQKSPLDLSFFFKLSGRMEAEGHPALFYTPRAHAAAAGL